MSCSLGLQISSRLLHLNSDIGRNHDGRGSSLDVTVQNSWWPAVWMQPHWDWVQVTIREETARSRWTGWWQNIILSSPTWRWEERRELERQQCHKQFENLWEKETREPRKADAEAGQLVVMKRCVVYIPGRGVPWESHGEAWFPIDPGGTLGPGHGGKLHVGWHRMAEAAGGVRDSWSLRDSLFSGRLVS